VYREERPSPAADATIERLLAHDARFGYLSVVRNAARRRMARLGAYGVEDLVQDTVSEIVLTLPTPRGEGAERSWVRFVHDCMEEAHRKFVGRRGERLPQVADATPEEMERLGPIGPIFWHGCVEPSKVPWIEGYVHAVMSGISDERMRFIGLDLLNDNPTPVSSDDPDDRTTLTARFNVDAPTIYRCRGDARAAVRAALERQNECEVDLTFMKNRRDRK
jgi:hypothetical protein